MESMLVNTRQVPTIRKIKVIVSNQGHVFGNAQVQLCGCLDNHQRNDVIRGYDRLGSAWIGEIRGDFRVCAAIFVRDRMQDLVVTNLF